MNNSDELKRFHFTWRESIPTQSAKVWDVPVLGYTSGSKFMIPAIRIGLEVNPELPKDPQKKLPKLLFSWSVRSASGWSKLTLIRQ